jgi:hypothetical protein
MIAAAPWLGLSARIGRRLSPRLRPQPGLRAPGHHAMMAPESDMAGPAGPGWAIARLRPHLPQVSRPVAG